MFHHKIWYTCTAEYFLKEPEIIVLIGHIEIKVPGVTSAQSLLWPVIFSSDAHLQSFNILGTPSNRYEHSTLLVGP